jgi:hypothetical protein
MSTGNQTTRHSASSNFTHIFNAAVEEYKKHSKQDIRTHPFATTFNACTTPDTILDVFRGQAQAFDRFREGEDKLIRWLNPTVQVLFTFSALLGEGIGLVSPEFLPRILFQLMSLSRFRPQRQYSQASAFFSRRVFRRISYRTFF